MCQRNLLVEKEVLVISIFLSKLSSKMHYSDLPIYPLAKYLHKLGLLFFSNLVPEYPDFSAVFLFFLSTLHSLVALPST